MKLINRISMIMLFFYLFLIGFNISFVTANVSAANSVGYFVAQSPLLNVAEPVGVHSPFWASRDIGAMSSPHGGLDLVVHGKAGAIFGYPVYSMADGIVVDNHQDCADMGGLGNSCGGKHGNHVTVFHGTHKVLNQDGKEIVSTVFTLYAHLKKGASSHITVGQTIKAGELLGEVASSGSSTGHHLHVSLYTPGEVEKGASIYGGTGDKSSAQPYIWPEGGKEDVDIPFEPTGKLYNALGEEQGEGAKASGVGSSGGGGSETTATEDTLQAINDEWKTPLINFQEREYVTNTKGLQSGETELFGATTIVGFTNATEQIYAYSQTLTLFLSVAFMGYMALVTIYYLVLLPRANSSWKLADIFEKTTGIDAIVTKKNTLDIIGRDLVSIFFIAFVLSGVYKQVFAAIYSLILVII